MSTVYDAIEDAIKEALTAPDAEETPSLLRVDRVETYGCQMTDRDLVEAIEKLKTSAPAAIVFYGGGMSNEGYGQVLDEEATFLVIVIASGTGRSAVLRSDKGLYELMGLTRSRLHGLRNAKIPNPLVWKKNQRMPVEWAVTAAAMVMEFGTTLTHE